MDGALWGLLLGLGLASIWWSFWPREVALAPAPGRNRLDRLGDEIVLAGIRGLGPPSSWVSSCCCSATP